MAKYILKADNPYKPKSIWAVMKFPEEISYEIADSAVRKADRLRVKLNENLSLVGYQEMMDSNFGVLSLETYKQIKDVSKKIKRALSEVDKPSLNLFDRLVLADIIKNVNSAESYSEYIFNPKTGVRTRGLVSTIFGKGAYDFILNAARPENYPHKALHNEVKLLAPFMAHSYSAEEIAQNTADGRIHAVKQKLSQKLALAKSKTEQFYKARGIIDNLEDIKFEFSPDSWGFSYWNGSRISTARIDPQRIICYLPQDGREIKTLDSMVLPIAIHEISHALHEQLSKETMPEGLAPDSQTYIPFIQGTDNEGVALMTEEFWLGEAEGLKVKDRLGMRIAESLIKNYLPRKIPQLAYDLLRKVEDERDANPAFPASLNKRVQLKNTKLTGIRYNIFTDQFIDRSIAESLQQMTYVFGKSQVAATVRGALKKGYTQRQVMLGLFKGCWTDNEAKRTFLMELYLPELKRRGIR